MKSSILAVAATMAVSASATHLKRHAHALAHEEVKLRAIMGSGSSVLLPTGTPGNSTCGCSTVYETVYGEWSWLPNPPAATVASSAVAAVSSPAVVSIATTSSSSVYVAPTTSSVYVAPSSSSVYIAPSSSSVYVAPTTSSVYVAPTSVYVAPTSSSVYVAPSSVAVAASSAVSSAASSSSSGGSGTISAADTKGITYTPYSSSGACLKYAEVLVDLTLIKAKGFTAVRTYSTDCSTIANVGGAAKILGLKLIMGIYIDATGVSGNAASQVSAIAEWAQWDVVEMFVVGNEAVFNEYCTVNELVSFIQSTKTTFNAAGYTGTYTTAEPLNIIYELVSISGFCDSIDLVGGNFHPFFNAQVDAAGAGAFVAAQLSIVDGLCTGKSGINLETGWPSAGTCNGLACPGTENQQIAVASIVSSAGPNSVVFSYSNDLWKAVGEYDCEQSWGLVNLFK